ncbi:hypothetical protein C5H24_12720, partial [Xylella fastidiosa]
FAHGEVNKGSGTYGSQRNKVQLWHKQRGKAFENLALILLFEIEKEVYRMLINHNTRHSYLYYHLCYTIYNYI